jgi:hypothetical protein
MISVDKIKPEMAITLPVVLTVIMPMIATKHINRKPSTNCIRILVSFLSLEIPLVDMSEKRTSSLFDRK